MARRIDISNDGNSYKKEFLKILGSSRINFLLGSGASMPAISTAGNIETELDNLIETNNDVGYLNSCYGFLNNIQKKHELLALGKDDDAELTLSFYREFVINLETILLKRKAKIIPKQVNLFTTNYDLFIELACERNDSVILNDGFRRKAAVSSEFKFETSIYSNTVYMSSNIYDYQVEVPSINLYKLHGSLTWKINSNNIVYDINKKSINVPVVSDDQKQAFIDSYSLILPRKNKFSETLLEHVYYDLLRMYSNELDRENVALFVFGFSFSDNHIKDITIRAIKNPTLKIIIFAYSKLDADHYCKIFTNYQSVDVISLEDNGQIDFPFLNKFLVEAFMVEENE